MKKLQFILDFVFRSFFSHFGKWMSSIVILLCGIIIVNISFAAWSISQKEIDKNFTNNDDLKILNVTYDAQSARMTDNAIASYSPTDMYYKPMGNVTNTDEPIQFAVGDDEDDVMGLRYIVLNYDLLKYIQLAHYFSEEQWNTENMIIFNDKGVSGGYDEIGRKFSESSILQVDDFQLISLQLGDNMQQTSFVNEDRTNKLALKKYNIDDFNLFLPRKWENYSIISEQTWMNIMAQKSGKSANYIQRNVQYPNGMRVVVKNFKDIDTVADNFKLNQFNVEYGLSDFENLTQTVEYFKVGSIVFSILIIIMIVITNVNLIRQFIAEQRHEIGLMKSLGYSNGIILVIHLGEFILQSVIIVLLISLLDALTMYASIGLTANYHLYLLLLLLDFLLLLILPTLIIFFIIHQEVRKEDSLLLKGA